MTTQPIPDETSIAVINTNITYIQKDISNISVALEKMATIYVTREALATVATETGSRLNKLERSSGVVRWVYPSASAVMGSIVTFLFINFIQHLK